MEYLKVIAALALVLALMGGLMLLLKKLGLGGPVVDARAKKRLKVVEILPVDAKHRLMLIKRDDAEHLIMVGGNGEVMVERDIKAQQNGDDD
ncbi:MAG: flagellar biosynthetic protein FliO [Alphaproteobacteria bacterium]